ncbi:PaaI family thioesterase [Mesobacillus maritimus]|uniref:PaaI family thioesterase n=1 Tax=Mesobacillus maritimus TaxID=1643336 RepID=UPI0032E8005D
MMKDEELVKLMADCVELANDDDIKILKDMLTGMKQKLENKRGTYIEPLLQMKRQINSDTYELTVPVTPLINNNLDIVHGGVTATIIDTAMGMMAVNSLPEGYAAVTTQLNIHYLAPGIGNELTCKAHFVHKGTKIMVLESDVFRDDGKKIAHATGSFFVIKK